MTNLLISGDPGVNDIGQDAAGGRHGGAASRWTRLVGLAIWLGLIAAYWQYVRVNDLSPLQTVQQLVDFLANNPLGVLVYVLLYMLRPVVFFPATLLTLAAGYVYGPIWGLAIVIVASNLSSMVAYLIGRFFGAGLVDSSSGGAALQRYADRMRRNSFETVLIMRFLFLPYDLVSYFAGFLRVSWQGFLLATILGSIPGSISFILFGAAFEGGFTGALPRMNPASLALAAAMFVISLGLSRWFKRREAHRMASSGETSSIETAS